MARRRTGRFEWDHLTLGSRRTSRSTAIPQPVCSGRCAALTPPHHRRTRRRGAGRHSQSSGPVRNRFADTVLHRQDRVAFEHLEPSSTQSLCPYKGVTSGYWSVRVGDAVHPDLAWTYHYPLPAVAPDHWHGRVLQREARHHRRRRGRSRGLSRTSASQGLPADDPHQGQVSWPCSCEPQ